jgi:hypothetical protein
MRKQWMVVVLSVLFLAVGTFVYAQDAMEASAVESAEEPLVFGGIVTGTQSGNATVEAVDAATRTVTLKNEIGEVRDVSCGPEVKNFDQIKKGDVVTLTVSQMAEVTVMKGTDAPLSKEISQEVESAKLGEKPAATVTTTIKVMGMVEDINYENRTAVLKGPERTMTVEAGPEAVNFDKVKKGDNVYIELMEEVNIAVTTP